ncbi:MAG TPA: hypothetical protein GX506_03730, partial [Firmicutes bacterium]|nr:hypothetical protein [Bacillota bacterium]
MRIGFIRKSAIITVSLMVSLLAACLAASGEVPHATWGGGAHFVLTLSGNEPVGPNIELFSSLSTSIDTAKIYPDIVVDSAGVS